MALSSKEQENIIKNKTIRAASNRRTATKIIVIVLIAALLITGGAYGVMTYIDANTMLISISDAKDGLALCETPDFLEYTNNLDMNAPSSIDAYTYPWFNIQSNILGQDGAHHGAAYVAYSFYVKNISKTSTCKYNMGIRIIRDTKNISSALRVLVIESDENNLNEVSSSQVYGKAKSDGTSEYVSYDKCEKDQLGVSLEELNASYALLNTNMATPFYGELYDDDTNEDLGYYIMFEKDKRLTYSAYKKYTIVVWLEGTDLQCVNDIVGGKCSISTIFTVTEYEEPEYYGA